MARPDQTSMEQAPSFLTRATAVQDVLNGMTEAFLHGDIGQQYYTFCSSDHGFSRSVALSVGRPCTECEVFDKYAAERALKAGWAFVYVLEGTHQGRTAYKIGKANNIKDRVRRFEVKIPFDVRTILSFHVKDAYSLESALHRAMRAVRVGGEWFALTKRHLDLVFLLGAAQEQTDYSALIHECLDELCEQDKMPDADYIEYLESLLVMNGVAFSRRGPQPVTNVEGLK